MIDQAGGSGRWIPKLLKLGLHVSTFQLKIFFKTKCEYPDNGDLCTIGSVTLLLPGLSVKISKKGAKLRIHAPSGALVLICILKFSVKI